jgi:hypothetical protein
MQKFSLIILFVVALGFTANAQVAKGSMTVGGDVSIINNSYTGGGSSNSTSFSPSFGYFLSDQWLLGVALGITSSSTTGGLLNGTSNTTAFTPFVRYYKFTSDDKFAFFAQGAVGFSSTTGQSSTTSISVKPGFAYFFTPHWGLDFTLPGIAYSSGNNTNSFGITASLTPSIGFRYYFGK